MYKLRISKWRLKKNFKRSEYEQVALRLRPFLDVGLDLPETLIDGKAVPLKRVKRQARIALNPRLSKQCIRGNPSQTSWSRQWSDYGQQEQVPGIVRITLQQSTYLGKFERLLIQVNNYYGPQLCHVGRFSEMDQHPYHEFFPPLNNMQWMYSTGHVEPLKASWNRWSPLVLCLIRQCQSSPDYFQGMVVQCSRIVYGSDYFVALLLPHLARLIRSIVGSEHPLSMLFDLIDCAARDSTGNLRVLTRLFLDIVSQAGVTSKLYCKWAEHYAGMVGEETDYETTVEFYENIINRDEEAAGLVDGQAWKMKFNLGYCHFKYHQDEKAEEIMRDIVSEDSLIDDWTQYLALDTLGAICEDRGDIERAEKWYSAALSFCLSLFGEDNPETIASATTVEAVRLKLAAIQSSLPQIEELHVAESVAKELIRDLSRLEISEGLAGFDTNSQRLQDDISISDGQWRQDTQAELKTSTNGTDDPQLETVYDLEQNLEGCVPQTRSAVNGGDEEHIFDSSVSLDEDITLPLTQNPLWSNALPEVPPHWTSDLASLSDIDFNLDLDCFKQNAGVFHSEDSATDFNMDDWLNFPREENKGTIDSVTDN